MNNSIIVLGGSGFLGKEILKQLRQRKFSLVACGDYKPCQMEGVKNITLDVFDYKNLKQFCQPFDTIINCTGQISQPINLCLRLNLEGISNIARICKDDEKRIIQISTVGVYGTKESVDETTLANPETPYSTCKYFAEYILMQNLPTTKLTILRLSNLFGTEQPKGIFSYLLQSYRSNHKLNFNNDGSLNRYYLHVEDAAIAIAKIAERSNVNGTYNLAGKNRYSIKELVAFIESFTKTKFEIEYNKVIPLENIGNICNDKIKAVIPINYLHSVEDFLSKSL